ncbi:MAG: redox-sensing transcriptional repressor Rex [Bacteroidales bacterium]|nr:redox-sensing transcriptional repressor Rex [Bacteroidales bacterium]
MTKIGNLPIPLQKKLPPRSVERLSKYRRLLGAIHPGNGEYIFSHDLAQLLNLTPEQVRRDLMLIGLTGSRRKGYSIKALIELIGKTIDKREGYNVAIVGVGNLGKAITAFIRKTHTRLNIVAAFDVDSSKINKETAGVFCYDISQIPTVVRKLKISIVILTVPSHVVKEITGTLVSSGIKGILNFTSVHLDVPSDVYLKDYDIITSLEEIGFFIKK